MKLCDEGERIVYLKPKEIVQQWCKTYNLEENVIHLPSWIHKEFWVGYPAKATFLKLAN